MKSDPSASSDEATRHQLLAAAAEVFATLGFRDATVREICRRAGANIAAVNYHFGDKQKLYAAVMLHAQQQALEKHPLLPGVGPDAPPEKKLHAFVLSLLLRIFDKGPTAWHGKLMAREMIEPTTALDALVKERIRPMANQLQKIIAEIINCQLNDECLRLCIFSVVSQCLFYNHCQPVILRLFPKQTFEPAEIARLAEHITRFSLAAMKHLSEAKTTKLK